MTDKAKLIQLIHIAKSQMAILTIHQNGEN